MENPSCNILIIEDDPDIGSTMRMILEHKGYTVYHLDNVTGMKELIQNRRIGMVITDMLLTDTDGTQICRELKNDVSFAHIPLIMMSAYPDAEDVCRQSGADDFICKPFDLENLLFKVKKFTEK